MLVHFARILAIFSAFSLFACGSSSSKNADTAGAPSQGGSPASGGLSGGGMGGMAQTGGAAVIGASDLPIPAGDANVPEPSGAPGGLTVLHWAGFQGAVSYTFDDANASQIAHYDELQALGELLPDALDPAVAKDLDALLKNPLPALPNLGPDTKLNLPNLNALPLPQLQLPVPPQAGTKKAARCAAFFFSRAPQRLSIGTYARSSGPT